MRDRYRIALARQARQQGRHALVEASKRHLVNDRHHARESLGHQVEEEAAPEVIACDPRSKRLGRDHHRLGLLLDGGDRWKGLPGEDGVRSQDARFTGPESVEGYLPTGFADLIDAHGPRDQERDGANLLALDKDIPAGRNARQEPPLLERMKLLVCGTAQDRKGLHDPPEVGFINHRGSSKHRAGGTVLGLKDGNDLPVASGGGSRLARGGE